jgi:hypothetical protein
MLLMDEAEHPIPVPMRPLFRQVAAALAAGDLELSSLGIAGVAAIPPETARHIGACVTAYGDTLAALNDATWERSVYRWMHGYWQFLVDLSTAQETVSDLTLHARLYEGDGRRLEIDSVHVP